MWDARDRARHPLSYVLNSERSLLSPRPSTRSIADGCSVAVKLYLRFQLEGFVVFLLMFFCTLSHLANNIERNTMRNSCRASTPPDVAPSHRRLSRSRLVLFVSTVSTGKHATGLSLRKRCLFVWQARSSATTTRRFRATIPSLMSRGPPPAIRSLMTCSRSRRTGISRTTATGHTRATR